MITIVITVVVLLILIGVFYATSYDSINKTAEAKAKQQLSEIKKGVDSVRIKNAKIGTKEEQINRGFIKVQVEDEPDSFVSFDEDTVTGYAIDLSKINYEKNNTGREYLTLKEGDKVKFNENDLYVYDAVGTVYYLKGYLIEGNDLVYSVNGDNVKEGPIVDVISTLNGNVKLKVTPRYGGSITSVIVGTKRASSTDGTYFEVNVDSNGTYIVVATEEGGNSTRKPILVGDINSNESSERPKLLDVYLNNRERYTNQKLANLFVLAENAAQMSISQNVLQIPIVTDYAKWRVYSSESSLTLREGLNQIYVWVKNSTNDMTDYKVAEIVLDTKAPTRDAPSYVLDGYKILIGCNQKDENEIIVEYGYKSEADSEFTWQESQIVVDVEPGVKYELKTRATDLAGNFSESRVTTTNNIIEIPDNIEIVAYPTNVWTRRVSVAITYPGTYGVVPYENLYRVNDGEWKKVTSNNVLMSLISNSKIEAVVTANINGVVRMGKIKEYNVSNIDRIEPYIYDVFELENYIQQGYDLTFKVSDKESGIVAWAVTDSNVEPTTWAHNVECTTEPIECSERINQSGIYYIWAKDKSGLTNSERIVVDKVDLTDPIINDYQVNYGTGSATLVAEAVDEKWGITGYVFMRGENATPSESDWILVNNERSPQTFTTEVTENDFYTIFVRDASGRISSSKKYVKVKYTVTYNYRINNGESINIQGGNTILTGCNSNVDLTPVATREYSSMVGWNTDPNSTTGLESIRLGDMSTGQEDMTIYAIFSYDDTISFSKSNNDLTYEFDLSISKYVPFTTLQYSFDNSTWTNYVSPLYINRNGTVYARTIYQNQTVKTATIEINNICENHNYRAATCTADSRCTLCSKYNGPALGHYMGDWYKHRESTCTVTGEERRVCQRGCGYYISRSLALLPHKYNPATCYAPATCLNCGATSGNPLRHSYTPATCTVPRRCLTCGGTVGKALGHAYDGPTCTTAAVCRNCNRTGAAALGHDWREISVLTESGKYMIKYRCMRCHYVTSF